MYRAGQKRIANEALAALSQEASDLIREVQAKSRELSASGTSATVQPGSASGDENLEQAAAAHSKQLQSGAEQPQSMPLLEVLPGSVAWEGGLACVLDRKPGDALATEPLSGAFSAGSSKQLVLDLAAARCRPSQAGKCYVVYASSSKLETCCDLALDYRASSIDIDGHCGYFQLSCVWVQALTRASC